MRTRMMIQGVAATAGLMLLSAAAFAQVQINVGTASGAPGSQVNVDVSLVSGNTAAATSNDVLFDPTVVTLTTVCASGTNKGNVCVTDSDCPGATGTAPFCNANSACKVNPDIGPATTDCINDPTSGPCKTLNKATVACASAPSSDPCPTGDDALTRFRGIILSTANTNTIPDGVLYTCTFTIAADASGSTTLQNVNASASDPSGNALTTTGGPGAINVVLPPTSTPTPTVTDTPVSTSTPVNTNTPVPTSTSTPKPTATITNTPAPTNTAAPSSSSSGCQIGAAHNSQTGWLLMLPVAALFVVRRRSR